MTSQQLGQTIVNYDWPAAGPHRVWHSRRATATVGKLAKRLALAWAWALALALVTVLWWIAVHNLSKSYASFCVKSVDLIGSDSARTNLKLKLKLNLNLNRRTDSQQLRARKDRAVKLMWMILRWCLSRRHWRWWWTCKARHKCSNFAIAQLFVLPGSRGSEGQSWLLLML